MIDKKSTSELSSKNQLYSSSYSSLEFMSSKDKYSSKSRSSILESIHETYHEEIEESNQARELSHQPWRGYW